MQLVRTSRGAAPQQRHDCLADNIHASCRSRTRYPQYHCATRCAPPHPSHSHGNATPAWQPPPTQLGNMRVTHMQTITPQTHRIISRQCRFAPCLARGSAGGPDARAGLLLETACNIATEILGTHFNHQGKIPKKTRHIGGRRLNLIGCISHFRCSRGLKNCFVVAWLKQHHQAASVPSVRSQKFAPATSAGAPIDPAD